MSLKFGADVSHSLQNVTPLFAALGGQYAFAAHPDQLHDTVDRHRRQPVGELPAGRAQRQRHAAQRRDPVLLPLECGRAIRAGRLESHAAPDAQSRPALQRRRCRAPRSSTTRASSVPTWRRTSPLATPLTLADGEVINVQRWCRLSFSADTAATRATSDADRLHGFRAALRLRLEPHASCRPATSRSAAAMASRTRR